MTLQQIHHQIETAPLRPYQMLIITLGVLINLLDGYDILALSLISPILTREWSLGPETLGLLFSAGLFGMAGGALLLSPIADVLGRRSAILVNLSLMSIGMLLSSQADSVPFLMAMRFITGLGVGAMASCVGTLVFEYCSVKTRNLGLGLVTIGYTVGTLIGTYAAPWLLEALDWRGIFVFGGVCSCLLIPVIYFLLPESLDVLAARRTPAALNKINTILGRLQLPALTDLPAAVTKVQRGSLVDLLRQPILTRTLLMAASYFLYMFTQYFFLNWNNQLTVNAGFTDSDGLMVARLSSFGGILGGIVIGIASFRFPIRPVSVLVLLAMGLSLIVFGVAVANLPLAQGSAFLMGFCIFGAAVVLYATGATTFPARVRATGMGVVMSAGRLGSTFGPASAGFLLGADYTRLAVCVMLAVPVFISIITLTRVPLTRIAEEQH
jgi:benzoate transport